MCLEIWQDLCAQRALCLLTEEELKCCLILNSVNLGARDGLFNPFFTNVLTSSACKSDKIHLQNSGQM